MALTSYDRRIPKVQCSPITTLLYNIGIHIHNMLQVRGGGCTPPGSVPWTVQLQVRLRGRGGRYSHRCGGSLVADTFVITAAHCLGSDSSQVASSIK